MQMDSYSVGPETSMYAHEEKCDALVAGASPSSAIAVYRRLAVKR